jgi:hypothetical protein
MIALMPEPHLNLWKKRLGHVPDSVWDQTGLKTLVLADNDLSEVSTRIGALKKLRMLDLGHNRLTCVPDALADLDGLTDFLYLHDNRLTSLPSCSRTPGKTPLPEHQRKCFRCLARMRLRHDSADRAPGIGQPADIAPRLGRGFIAIARITPQKQPPHDAPGIDRGARTTAPARPPRKPSDSSAGGHRVTTPIGETRFAMGDYTRITRVGRKSRGTRLRGLLLMPKTTPY